MGDAARERVLVLGYGEMGHAMEQLLAAHTSLAIWDRFPQPGFRSAKLAEAAPRARVLIFCVPTFPHEEVLRELLPLLPPDAACISVAKGLDEAGRPVARILTDVLGEGRDYGVLHGPMIAEEIQAGRHAFAQLGHHGGSVGPRVTALFAGTRLRVTPVADMTGVNWAAILKNVYALAFGMADQLGLGDNVRGWLAATALAELDILVRRLGGAPGTAAGLAGLGDLITTATSAHSHHRELGRRLAMGEARVGVPGGLGGEAIRTLAIATRGGLPESAGLPLFGWIRAVVEQPGDVRRRFGELLAVG